MKLKNTSKMSIWTLSRAQIDLTINEYSSVWGISAQVIGYQIPSALDWRYSKKLHKTKKDAVKGFISQFSKTYPEHQFNLGYKYTL